MDTAALRQRLATIIAPDVFNDWELDEQAEKIARFAEVTQEEILRQYQAIWPVSHALCALFLHHAAAALQCLAPEQLGSWTNALLDIYERQGLHEAGAFMADVEKNFLCRLRGESGTSFAEAAPRLRPYVQALAGPDYDLVLAPAAVVSTDTATLFLPHEFGLFKEQQRNFLLFKLTASLLWAQATGTTYRWELTADAPLLQQLGRRYRTKPDTSLPPLAAFFSLFPDPILAADLFLVSETTRLLSWLKRQLPGLMRDATALYPAILRQRPHLPATSLKNAMVELLTCQLCGAPMLPQSEPDLTRALVCAQHLLPTLAAANATTATTAACTARFYELAVSLAGPYQPTIPLPFAARIKPAEALAARRRQRQEDRQRFIKALAALLPQTMPSDPESDDRKPGTPPPASSAQADAALLMPATADHQPASPLPPEAALAFITVDNQPVELPEEVRRLARRIAADLGLLPQEYISAAAGIAGSGYRPGEAPAPNEEEEPLQAPLTYDEWDFRRNGFRKNWCILHEKEILPTKGTFVENVGKKHRGLLLRLRRQFEMMRLSERFVRRQRDGDDLDLDAIIESLSDSRAGLSPSERLFVRLRRDERNIAVVFLVDLSSSTEGWVNTAIKESLILMCEALTVLGDSYAVYGFSGMRRLRSEIYHVKHLDEPYNELVKGKIAALSPQEYTRMGPPIRHVTRLLAATDAKVRLLITLSDGKPEDYDDYKGDYAIEDTRHALIEAKALGIHPFCITIDQEAHDYIAHMYGEVNYICINDVRNLPNRVPEIYRALTC